MASSTARYLRRSAVKQIAAYKSSHTAIKVFSLDNNFAAKDVVDNDFVWNTWATRPRSTMKIEQNGTLTLRVHDNRWYVLSDPSAVATA